MTSPLGFPGLTDVVTVDEHPLLHRHRATTGGRPVLIEVLTDDAASDRAFVDDHPGLLSPIEIGETTGSRCASLRESSMTKA